MVDTSQILEQVHNNLQSSVDNIYGRDSLAEHLKAMTLETPTVASQIHSIGEQFDAIVVDPKNIKEADADKYIVQFHWIEEAKSFLILWRDILLECTKAHHYHQDGKVDYLSIKRMQDQSKAMLTDCILSLRRVYNDQKTAIGSNMDQISAQVSDWEKQINPWDHYSQQIKAISEQSRNISNLSNQLGRSNSGFNRIKKVLQSYIDKHKANMTEISSCSEMALDSINDIDEVQINKKVQEIEGIHKTLNQLFVDNHHLEQIEKIIEEMADEIEVPIHSDNGLLNVKKLSLKKLTQQWLESEIYLTLYEVEEVEDQLKNKLKMILVNIRNHMALLKNDSSENKGALLTHAIEKFKAEYKTIAAKHSQLIRKANRKLDNQLNISELFNEQRLFLPLSVQPTLGKLDLRRTKLRYKFSEWMKTTFSAYNGLRKKAESERKLSASEKLVRYVDSRQFAEDNRQYINIFLVKGYIGESFVIGRQEELDHFRNIYSNWLQGYRGSVVITGQRFSGKTLFAEYANIKVIDGKAIQLLPNKEYEINGRVYTATHDLKLTLGNITKHSYDIKPTVIIDDIELWYNKEISLASNIRALSKIIDRYSSKIFFVVTMSNWMQAKMNSVFGLDRVFQADINLDRMSLEEIRNVISIRQGATHKYLLNTEEKRITATEFEKITKRLHQNVDGNVGDALSKWAAATQYHDANSVMLIDKPFYSIPDIDHKDTLLLLETVIMARKTNEYYLNQYFGAAFKARYSTLLQRLVNVGLITRNVDNLIQINPKVVNDIGRLLENKHYLTFNHI